MCPIFCFSIENAMRSGVRESVRVHVWCFIQEKPLETPHGVVNNRTWHLSSGCVRVHACIPYTHSDFLMTTSVAHIHFILYCVCGALVWRWMDGGERQIEVVLLKPMPHIKQFKMQLLILWARQITPMVAAWMDTSTCYCSPLCSLLRVVRSCQSTLLRKIVPRHINHLDCKSVPAV